MSIRDTTNGDRRATLDKQILSPHHFMVQYMLPPTNPGKDVPRWLVIDTSSYEKEEDAQAAMDNFLNGGGTDLR